MTPNLELLKKIQPLFEKWNMWDRGWDNIEDQEVIYIGTDAGCPRFITKEGVFVFLFTGDRQTRILHYPYPHQMWEKVDWSKFKMAVFNDGSIAIHIGIYTTGITDPETALLKALVWQMEQEEDSDRGKQGMIKINSKMFYCECGCNVFTKLDKDHFRCNSCEAIYYGE